MKPEGKILRPLLARHTRYRWDALRRQHQLVYPEGILVLNESGAAIVRLCDGRSLGGLVGALQEEFPAGDLAAEVEEFLARLKNKGLLRDATDA